MNVAVFTIVRNEKYFLPIWLNHYRNILGWNDIYIIDNGTTDGSTDYLPCNIIKKESKTAFNAKWMLSTVKDIQDKLLDWYDYVIFSEVDELIYHRYNRLIDHIIKQNKEVYQCQGYEIKQENRENKKLGYEIEPDIDLQKPLLRQRKQWHRNTRACKALIARVPVRWEIGFHLCKNEVYDDPEIYMVHLHKLDFKLALKRNLERMNIKMDKESQNNRKGWQNFLETEDQLMKFWHTGHSGMGKLEDIPEWIKNEF